MRVKRYIVDTMPDAMSKIRTELGADAVILSTKDMKVGGFMGLFGKKRSRSLRLPKVMKQLLPSHKRSRPELHRLRWRGRRFRMFTGNPLN